MSYTGIAYDAMRKIGLKDEEFLLSRNIKPLSPHSYILGKVFTTRGEIIRNKDYQSFDKIRLNIYSKIQSGDVIVLEADDDIVAHAGDITMTLYRDNGAIGFITDGNVRDSNRILKMDFPCFCKDTTPVDAIDYWAITDFQAPIKLPSVNNKHKILIAPGDIVVADNDGVIIVPIIFAIQFKEEMEKFSYNEERILRDINYGKSIHDIYKEYGRW
jgi:regulator of RNase E activity RraA